MSWSIEIFGTKARVVEVLRKNKDNGSFRRIADHLINEVALMPETRYPGTPREERLGVHLKTWGHVDESTYDARVELRSVVT